MKQRQQSCELCNGDASLYCDADSAYLCWRCDRRVHSANFLVARHVRRLTCSTCCSLSDHPSLSLSGPGSDPIRSLCRSCHPNPTPKPSTSASSESSCVSSSGDSPPPATRSATAVRALERWGKGMGLRSGRRCAGVAARVMGAYEREMTGAVPLRVAMAAAMWFAVRVCDRTCEEMLRRLEKCSGVPAKVIVFYEARIARAAVGRRGRGRGLG